MVHPGIDPRFSPGGERSPHPMVVAVGRLAPVKRYDALVRAAHHARSRVPGLQLHIVGDGYERPLVESVISELDAGDWVTLRGHLTDTELVDLYRQTWIVASASAREGWGMTMTEAAACGTPAVATRIAGHSDAVRDGVSGLLAEGDPESLGDAMAEVLGDPDLRARLERRGARLGGPAHLEQHGHPAHARGRRRGVAAPIATMRNPLTTLAHALGRRGPALATVAPEPATSPPAAPARTARPAVRAPAPPRGPWLRLLGALALVAYVPLLLTQRGWVSADTKTYLYIDPSKLMSRAWSMWDPSIGLGTVTHQNVGYLWPMGPYYWLLDQIGVPDWAAQRIWWGTIIFAAGAGVAYLLRTLGWRGPGVVAATFVYALTPYLLTLVARLSAILLPFVALPWLVAFTILTARTKGWRYPALFALVVATCGSVNATALLLVGVAPVLWLAHAVWVAQEITLRTAVRAGLRIGALTVPLSAWWIAGLSVQGTNGIEILRYTETAKTVAAVSVSHEVLRGLGYWFFYGGDRLGPWIEPSEDYTQFLPLVALTYLVPIAGLAGGVVARWRHRAYFVVLTAVGVALAVGAYPWEEGTPWSRALKAFLLSDVGLSMRSLPRAVPLVALGVAVLLGAGVTSLARRWPRTGRPLTVGVALVALLALPPLWLGRFVPENLRRPEQIPAYWDEAAAHLDAAGGDTRVLVLPGTDFASYRWGNTVDPVLPGLIDRPSVQRELIPYGSAASANLLNAFDLRLQERTADPDSLAPIARLMRAGDVLVQSDLQYERYNTPRPRNFWAFVTGAPGFGEPVGFGPGEPNETVTEVQLEDELLLQTDPTWPDPPEVAVLPVEDPVGIVSTHPVSTPLLVSGDGPGIVDAAGAGLIDGRELIRYSASLHEDEIQQALDDGAVLLVTDTNRRRGERWTTVRHTRGYTETADSEALADDPTDNRLPLFPDADDDAMTVANEQWPGGGERHQLRQPDHVHHRGAPGPGGRRRPGDGVAHRGVRRRPRASASSSGWPTRSRPTT